MQGADVAELQRLAARADDWAHQLEYTFTQVNRVVHSAPWYGQNAEAFRSAWGREYAPGLHRVADVFRQMKQDLLIQANQQQQAQHGAGSGTSGGVGRGGSVSRLLDVIEELIDRLGLPKDVADFGVGVIDGVVAYAAAHVVAVKGYVTASGRQVAPYLRWAPGQADRMRRLLGEAGQVSKYARHVGRIGKGLALLGGVIGGGEYYFQDTGHHGGERVTRAVAVGVLHAGGALVGMKAGVAVGAMAGAAFGGPVGAVIGAGVGIAVGFGVPWLIEQTGADDLVADAAGAGYRWAADRVGDVAETGRDILDGGGRLLGGGANLAKKGWDAIF
jgi:hypothetical protein